MIPFFSIVIPLYNKEKYVLDTLKSVFNQTFRNFEVIIINDGSTDKSLEIISTVKDDRLHIYNQKNVGLSATRNFGIKNANTEYIAFLDADDLWMEDYLETINKLILSFKDQSVFAADFKILTSGQTANLKSTRFSSNHLTTITNYSGLAKSKISFSSLVINKKVFEEIGYFDEGINYGEDEDFHIRCFEKNDLVIYKLSKTYYRVGFENQMTNPNSNLKRVIPNFNDYLNSNNYKDLKPYLDFIHYKLVVLFKMERNHDLVKFYKQKIDTKNLELTQKIKYHLPIEMFYFFKSIYLNVSNT